MESQDDLAAELERTKRLLAELTEKAEENTGIWQRSQQRELTFLNEDDIAALFRQMLFGLKDSYRLDAVSVVLCDPDHDVRHLLIAGGDKTDEFPGLMFAESLVGLAPQYVSLTKP